MRKRILFAFACFCFSLLLVGLLYYYSDKVNHKPNSFLRLFAPHPVLFERSLAMQADHYYFAGMGAGHIYLGNIVWPLQFMKLSMALKDTQTIRFHVRMEHLKKLAAPKLAIDSPWAYIIDGISPEILRGLVDTPDAVKFMFDSAYFSSYAKIGSSSFAIRPLSGKLHQYILAKVRADSPNFKLSPDLLQKQIDGIFCTDGIMDFDKSLNRLVYVYRYRNQFIVTDSNLHLIYRGRTIDTVTQAQIKVSKIQEDSTVTLESPGLTVNRKACASGGWLFVNSTLFANNEQRSEFDIASVIDVYNLKTGSYRFSFYLYDFGKEKMREFKVSGNHLAMLTDHFVVLYQLNPAYFH